jgi:hypothetical protein
MNFLTLKLNLNSQNVFNRYRALKSTYRPEKPKTEKMKILGKRRDLLK